MCHSLLLCPCFVMRILEEGNKALVGAEESEFLFRKVEEGALRSIQPPKLGDCLEGVKHPGNRECRCPSKRVATNSPSSLGWLQPFPFIYSAFDTLCLAGLSWEQVLEVALSKERERVCVCVQGKKRKEENLDGGEKMPNIFWMEFFLWAHLNNFCSTLSVL